MDLNDYLKIEWNTWFLNIKVIPNAKQTEIWWIMSDWILKIRIKSIPEKWKANTELINFISKELKLRKNLITIISWLTSRNKLVKIDL